jgi:hypothetical protein
VKGGRETRKPDRCICEARATILGQAESHELQLRLTTRADMEFMMGKLDKGDAGECFEKAR